MAPPKQNDVSNLPFWCLLATGPHANDCHEAWYGVQIQSLKTRSIEAKKALARKTVRHSGGPSDINLSRVVAITKQFKWNGMRIIEEISTWNYGKINKVTNSDGTIRLWNSQGVSY